MKLNKLNKLINQHRNLILLFIIAAILGYYLIPKMQTFVIGGQRNLAACSALQESMFNRCVSDIDNCTFGSERYKNTLTVLGGCLHDGVDSTKALQRSSRRATNPACSTLQKTMYDRCVLDFDDCTLGSEKYHNTLTVLGGCLHNNQDASLSLESEINNRPPPSAPRPALLPDPTLVYHPDNITAQTTTPGTPPGSSLPPAPVSSGDAAPPCRTVECFRTRALMNRLRNAVEDNPSPEERATDAATVTAEMDAAGVTPHHECGRILANTPITCAESCNAEYGFCHHSDIWPCIMARHSLPGCR
jgi:hypothetical protein